ncbi:MAG TPA: ATP-binding protein, partial [Ktedonobacterales bacterium]
MDQTAECVSSASAAMAGPQLSLETVFPGAGEMAERMRAMDWSQTPLGRVEDWPQSLRTAVSICLHSRFPILIWWGPDLVMLYNDAYRLIVGAKHPASLGAAGRQVWPEIWHIIGPMLKGVLHEGKATWSDDQFLPLERSGYAEECYFTFSYSPIQDESGGVAGVFCAVTETTSRVLAERRTRTARDVAAAIVDAHTAESVCQRAIEVVGHDAADVPFALLYLLDRDGTHAHLAATAGLIDHHALAFTALTLPTSDEETSPAGAMEYGVLRPLLQAAQTGAREVIPLAAEIWHEVLAPDRCEWMPKAALMLPITEPGQSRPSAMLVAGVSPMRALDDDYEGFYDLLVSHLASGLAAAHAYEEERKRAETLAELDRAKTTFFSNVSHEFRTPLTLMLGPLEDSLSDTDEPLPPRQRDRQLLVQRNSLRLLKLVNTLLDFARIESGRAQATYAPTDLAAFTAELASSFRSLIEKAGMELVVDCPPLDSKVKEPVYVDREMWEKIVLNLVSNAFKFTFEGTITVALHPIEDGRQIALTVGDSGVGITADELPRVFERFHRAHDVRSRSYEGSGIGLALVHELVHLHGGAITVASEVGHGTTFTITLPTGAAHLPPTRIQETATTQRQRDQHKTASTALGAVAYVEEASRWLPDGAADFDGGDAQRDDDVRWLREDGKSPVRLAPLSDGAARARILLADDNADLREYLQRLLTAHYDVEVVPNGSAALAAAQARVPDLILSDVMMPELDGFGLLRALRDDPHTRAVPVILLSARAGEEATIEGLEAGADDYLVKPFSAREVLTRISSHLEITRLRREAMARARELETAFEAITDAVGIYDHEGYILRTNAAARAFFADTYPEYEKGSPAERAAIAQIRDEQGRPIPPDESGVGRLLRGEALTGSNALDVRMRSVDGRDLQVNISGAPLRDETGAIVGAIAVSRDVTERRLLERRTQEALDA